MLFANRRLPSKKRRMTWLLNGYPSVCQKLESSEIIQAFEQEVAAFERLKPTLIEMYPGQYVAIYLGEVIGTGDRKTRFT